MNVKKVLSAAGVCLTGSLMIPGGAAHAALPICASGAICFADLPDPSPSFEGLSHSIPRNTCIPLSRPNVTSYIDNETAVQWRVYTGAGCTGTMGLIFAHSAGPMAAPFDNSIDAVSRTANPGAAPGVSLLKGNAVSQPQARRRVVQYRAINPNDEFGGWTMAPEIAPTNEIAIGSITPGGVLVSVWSDGTWSTTDPAQAGMVFIWNTVTDPYPSLIPSADWTQPGLGVSPVLQPGEVLNQ